MFIKNQGFYDKIYDCNKSRGSRTEFIHVRNKIRGSRANYKLLLVGFFLKEPTQAG